jgi:hypothetical protein
MAQAFGKHLTIKHNLGDAKTVFANHFAVQSTLQGEFTILFFEVIAPLVISGGDPEETKRLVEGINEVEAKCVARIVVTKDRMNELARVLGEHFGGFVEATQGKEHSNAAP